MCRRPQSRERGKPGSNTCAASHTVPVAVLCTSTHGIWDSVIAPPLIERIFYDTLTGHAALGIILESDGKLADHASINDTAYGGNPGGELGYPTAWLAYQLRSDATAATAFTGAHPELVHNSNWPGSAVK